MKKHIYLGVFFLIMAGCGFNKETIKEAKCQIDRAGSKVVCEVPIPAEAVK